MMNGTARYFVQGERVRGEPRIYWVEDRQKRFGQVTGHTTSKRTAQSWCDKLNAGAATGTGAA